MEKQKQESPLAADLRDLALLNERMSLMEQRHFYEIQAVKSDMALMMLNRDRSDQSQPTGFGKLQLAAWLLLAAMAAPAQFHQVAGVAKLLGGP